MPSTIEAAAPYTPLNTSTFNNVLSDKDNNIQSAMETIDNQTRRVIFGDEDYYVRTDGLDTNDGTEDNTDHAWLTIQHALDVIGTFDLNSHAVKIHIADGTYTITSQLLIPSNVGGGVIWLTGNPGTPSNVVIQGNTGWCVFQNISPGVRVFLEGLKFTGTGGTWVGLQCSNLSYTRFWWCEFGTGLYINIYIADGAQVVGYWDYTISASCYCHVYSAKFGTFSMNGGMTVTLTGAPAWTVGFVFMDELSDFSGSGVIFSGAATGPRYMVALNSVINTGGGGAAYFPGNAAGTATTGGQYV